jgi:hypothetical protein
VTGEERSNEDECRHDACTGDDVMGTAAAVVGEAMTGNEERR